MVFPEGKRTFSFCPKPIWSNWRAKSPAGTGVLPNCLAPVLVQSTLFFATAILSAAYLGFLGLGAQPPTPEWGTMLSKARDFLRVAPHVSVFPGLTIMLTVLGLNLLGDGLRDVLDPRAGPA